MRVESGMRCNIFSAQFGLCSKVLLIASVLVPLAERPVLGQSSSGNPGHPSVVPANQSGATGNQSLPVNPLTGVGSASAANWRPRTLSRVRTPSRRLSLSSDLSRPCQAAIAIGSRSSCATVPTAPPCARTRTRSVRCTRASRAGCSTCCILGQGSRASSRMTPTRRVARSVWATSRPRRRAGDENADAGRERTRGDNGVLR